MLKVENRESAHLKSRVKDMSVVPNVADYIGLFAAITPISKLEKNVDGVYSPILIRDTESLIANFGDPRIDPEKYIDLYSIMQVIGNGSSCYVAKVPSGETGIYEAAFLNEPDIIDVEHESADIAEIKKSEGHNAESATTRTISISGLHNKYLVSDILAHREVAGVKASATDSGTGVTFEAKETGTEYNGYTCQIVDNDGLVLKVNGDDVGPVGSLPDSCPVTITGEAAAMAEPVTLSGGVNAEAPVDWDLASDTYTVGCVKVGDTYTLTVTVNPEVKIPTNIKIRNASLDPEYGREPITLEAVADTDGKVFTSNALDRKYTILKVKDGANEVDQSAFSVSWEYTTSGKYIATFTFDSAPLNTPTVEEAARQTCSLIAYSSMSDDIELTFTLSQAKPYSLKLYYLNVEASSNGNVLGTAKVKLESTTTNQSLVNNINSSIGTYVSFTLADPETSGACEKNDLRDKSIVYNLLEKFAPYIGNTRKDLDANPLQQSLPEPSTLSKPSFKVTLQDYIDAQMQYKDRKYPGCIMADLTAPVSHTNNGTVMVDGKKVLPLDQEERRSLHYNLKQIACERKDTTVFLSTPFWKDHSHQTPFDIDEVCQWVASLGDYANLWEYGTSNTTDYSIQSFYLEIYYSWLNQQCTKIDGGLAKSVKVKTAPSCLVVNNILTSYRERGVQYPVAGDQYGVLPETCETIINPKTQAERDQLVQYRINPIYDTGTRGVQIYGNETLNAGYTDLNAAHIARALVYIRSTIDEYTEKLKFSINSLVLWDVWKNYVTNYILEPLKSSNCLSEYSVAMGTDTTSREEIANRKINGNIALRFYQSAEIFDLTYTVYSSATPLEEAMNNR